MIKNQRGLGSVATIIIVVFLLVAIFIIGFFVGKKRSVITQVLEKTEKAAPIELTWQEYNNSNYDFTLKTPMGWSVVSGDAGLRGVQAQKIYIHGTSNSISADQIYIVITPLLGGENEKQAFGRVQDMDVNSLSSKEITLGEIQGTAYYGINNSDRIGVVTFVKNNNIYIAYDLKPEDRVGPNNIFLGIISSIKFNQR